MTRARILLWAGTSGFSLLAMLFHWVLGRRGSRAARQAARQAAGGPVGGPVGASVPPEGDEDKDGGEISRQAGAAEGGHSMLLLPGLSAEISGPEEVALYLHNGHDRSIHFQPQADRIVVTLRGADWLETLVFDVVDRFFPAGAATWLEAGRTAGPVLLGQPGLKKVEVPYRHVARSSTVETSRRVLTL